MVIVQLYTINLEVKKLVSNMHRKTNLIWLFPSLLIELAIKNHINISREKYMKSYMKRRTHD